MKVDPATFFLPARIVPGQSVFIFNYSSTGKPASSPYLNWPFVRVDFDEDG